MKYSLVLSTVLCMSLAGCVISMSDDQHNTRYTDTISWSEYHQKNRQVIANLTIGERLNKVYDQLHTPQYSELKQQGEATYRVLFYATSHDGNMEKSGCTALVFKNKVLIGWGERAYQSIQQNS